MSNIKIISSFLLFLIYQIHQCLSQPLCKESDFKKIYLPCDKNNQRSIIYPKINDCKISESNFNLTIPKAVNVTCSNQCEKGSIFNYDFSNKKNSCTKCPANSYSTGGAFSIQSWSKNILEQKGFKSNCLISTIGLDDFIENTDCQGFLVNEDGTNIFSGSSNLTDVKYVGMLILGVKLKNKGELKFRYKKDTINDFFMKNGLFILFVDYDLIYKDNEINSSWITYTHPLEAGDHNIVFVYDYWINPLNSETRKLKMQIESLEITGLDDASYECKKCIDGISPEGSGECFKCQADYYFNKNKEACEKCPDKTFSFDNSIGKDSCLEKKTCEDTDYKLISMSSCLNGKRKLFYNLPDTSFCILDKKNVNSSLVQEESCQDSKCPDGLEFSNEKCQQCPSGMVSNNSTNFVCTKCEDGLYAANVYLLNNFHSSRAEFNNTCISNNNLFCQKIKGWQFNFDHISNGKYFPVNTDVKLELGKYFYTEDSYGEIHFEIFITKISENESFEIMFNDQLIQNYTNTREISEILALSPKLGNNYIKFKYFRSNKASDIFPDSIKIKNFKIKDSTLFNSIQCKICPPGTYRKNSDGKNKCTYCDPGYTSNLEGTGCQKCPEGTFSNEKAHCVNCPIFTSTSPTQNSCVLDQILIKDDSLLRFNLSPLKNLIDKNCNSQSICYNQKFIGPIKNRNEKMNNHYKEMFFVSLFESDEISITDFSYDKQLSNQNIRTGNIFGLFDNPVVNVTHSDIDYISSQSKSNYQSIKLLKNLATGIEKVYLVDDKINNGVMIKYKEGDSCLQDPCKKNLFKIFIKLKIFCILAKKFESYMFLECRRDLASSAPYLYRKINSKKQKFV